jgi:hypothetical protein
MNKKDSFFGSLLRLGQKIFAPVFYLLTASSLQAASPSHSPDLDKKALEEVLEVAKELTQFNSDDPDPSEQSSMPSANEFGPWAVPLAKIRENVTRSKEIVRALEARIIDVDMDGILTSEVLFDRAAVIEKRNKLNQLLVFLDESKRQLEKILADFQEWMLSTTEISEPLRKGMIKGHSQAAEEQKWRIQETYRVKKDLVGAYINLLDFLSAKIYDSTGQKTGSTKIIETDEERKEFELHCETIEHLLQADEDIAAFDTQVKMDKKEALENIVSNLNPSKSLSVFLQIAQIYKEKIEPYNQAFAELDCPNIYTKAIVSSLENMADKKKKLGQICPILDEMEQKMGKDFPNLMRQMEVASDDHREILEEFIQIVLPLEKQMVSTRKKYVSEYLKLLNFFSLRYGNYKIDENGVYFSYDLENKLYGSYLKNINQLLQEEQNTALQIEQNTQRLRGKIQRVNNATSAQTL